MIKFKIIKELSSEGHDISMENGVELTPEEFNQLYICTIKASGRWGEELSFHDAQLLSKKLKGLL